MGVSILKIKSIINYFKRNAKGHIISFLGVFALFSLIYASYGKINAQILKIKKDAPKRVSKTIVLDAGHGGEDGGAVGNDGIVEKDVNLCIALKLRDYLEASGYDVVTTREEDVSIYDDDSKTLRQKKRSDLHNRADIIKDNEGENSIFVSIHQNKFPDPKYNGTQIFYSKNHSKSLDLANSIKESVVKLIQPENKREIKQATEKIYLLHGSEIPAVVVECGFLSNPDEAKKLASEEYQGQMAFCIYCGIINYFINNS